ncbi:alpha/beta hydrolase [Oryzihumus sp.]|uniref:alpha/beta fold hydrolase n=1 Tax=Oryzihumus sp. TaxID=1968903 RepID=UPI002ED9DD7A
MPTFTSHDGAVLHYDLLDDGARGEPLVVLAGGAARHPAYLGDLAGLSSVRPLVVVHQRGVGESAEAGPLMAWPELAHDVEALRRHLGGGQLDLLAHSAGTRVALAYAASYPQHVRRLCLVTPPPGDLVDVEDDSRAMVMARSDEPWFPAFAEAVPALEAASTPQEHRALSHLIAPLAWGTWDERAQAHEAVGDWYLDAGGAFFSAPVPEGLGDRLGSCGADVLVVAGERDALIGLAPVLAVAELFPRGTAVVVEQAGHYPWVERPEAFRAAVDPFLGADRG